MDLCRSTDLFIFFVLSLFFGLGVGLIWKDLNRQALSARKPFLLQPVYTPFVMRMAKSSFKLKRWVWSDNNLDEMSWHDTIVHGIAVSTELISRDVPEPRMQPQELLLDIDYVLNWRQALEERRAEFWISPATMIFGAVSDVKFDFASKSTPLLIVYDIRQQGHRWSIVMDGGQITFESDGFEQYIRREPIFKTNYTYLSDSERGGVSFFRGHGSLSTLSLLLM